MIRLTLRQHRVQLGSGLLFIAALGGLLLWTRHQMTGYLHTSGLSACLASGSGCDYPSHLFESRFGGLLGDVPWLNFVPLLVGIFWGAPLVAREVEQGTHRLAWTQDVSRLRWVLVKLAIFVTVIAALATVFSLMFGWWFTPFAKISFRDGFARMDPNVFDFRGIVPVGYAVYAFAVGTAAGVLIRRTLPAMAVTFAAYLPLRLGFQSLRSHLFSPLRLVYDPFATSPRAGHGDWVVQSTIIDRAGHAVANNSVLNLCAPSELRDKGVGPTQCLLAHGMRSLDIYQPDRRFWALQGVETAVFIGLGLLLLALSVWLVARHNPG